MASSISVPIVKKRFRSSQKIISDVALVVTEYSIRKGQSGS